MATTTPRRLPLVNPPNAWRPLLRATAADPPAKSASGGSSPLLRWPCLRFSRATFLNGFWALPDKWCEAEERSEGRARARVLLHCPFTRWPRNGVGQRVRSESRENRSAVRSGCMALVNQLVEVVYCLFSTAGCAILSGDGGFSAGSLSTGK
jgi:hypothetical protein